MEVFEMRKWTFAAVVVCALVCAPLALAASSPTVAPSSVTAIGQTGATLRGTVNPNGSATTYQFSWGTTNALGNLSPAAATTVGAGTAAVAESTKLTGLTPATTYYYALVATNSFGTTSTPVETFKTTGNPSPVATSEPATGLGRYTATMVGIVTPNNQATTYYFQYGPTDTYGLQTGAKVVPLGTVPVTVSQAIPGLAPGTVFHYRLVAYHGSTSVSYGADESFLTYPWPRPRTTTTLSVKPSHDSTAPFVFALSGTISRPVLMPAARGCSGTVHIGYYAGSRRLASTNVTVASNCRYSATTRIGSLPRSILKPHRTAQITVRAAFRGALYQGPSYARKVLTVG
jgi:hypothetical protein